MLRNAGWNVGEGLGKKKQGATEPLRVTRKTSRRGVGGEDPVDGSVSVVSNAFGEARSDVAARRAKRPRPSEARADASDECIEKPSRRRAGAETKRNVGDEPYQLAVLECSADGLMPRHHLVSHRADDEAYPHKSTRTADLLLCRLNEGAYAARSVQIERHGEWQQLLHTSRIDARLQDELIE